MKTYFSRIALVVAAVCSMYLSDPAFGQGYSGQSYPRPTGWGRVTAMASANVNVSIGQNQISYDGRYPSGPQLLQRSNTSTSGSRSASFTKGGKKVSVAENSEGITVSVDGQMVRAKDARELKNRYPDAYRLYDEGLKGTRATARAFASGAAGGGGGGGQPGVPGQFKINSAQNRSISIMENGKQISITENESGVTVFVNGRRVRTKDVAKLKKRFPESFEVYEKHLGEEQRPVGDLDANDLMREEVLKLRDQNAGNPQLRSAIERLIENLPR